MLNALELKGLDIVANRLVLQPCQVKVWCIVGVGEIESSAVHELERVA